MGEIKSSWELAMEKVERLGKLSPEELKRQEEEKHAAIAQVLAEKLLGGLAFWQLQVDLEKFGAHEREPVKAALRRKLVDEIELDKGEKLERVLDGLSNLMDTEELNPVKHDLGQLLQEYEEFEQKATREVEEAAGEVLHQLRISGSAIGGINPGVLPEWQERLDTVAGPYKERLEALKAKLRPS